MKKLILFTLTTFCLCLLSINAAFAKTVYCSNCSDRFTQALDRITNVQQLQQLAAEYTETVKQTAQQIALVQNNIEQLANLVQNTISLPDNLLNSAKQDLSNLANITASLQSQRGDISALSEIFNDIYPAMDSLGNIITDPQKNIEELWNKWASATDQAAETVFQISGQQLYDLTQNSDELNNHINRLLATPEGQMQALQAANNLTGLQIEEMRKLRELIATSTQAAVMAQMKDEKEKQLSKEIWQEMHSTDLLKKQYENYE